MVMVMVRMVGELKEMVMVNLDGDGQVMVMVITYLL